MKSAYCPHCNHKHSYSLALPKFCSNCGESMTSFKKKIDIAIPDKKKLNQPIIITPTPAKEKILISKRQPSFAKAYSFDSNDDYEEDEDGEIKETDVVEVPEIGDDFADSFQLSCSFAGRKIGSFNIHNGKIVNT